MKPTEIRERMANATLAELDEVWRDLSPGVKVGSGAHAHRHDRQHGSRAAKWLPIALAPATAAKTPLPAIARLDPPETGARARAAFLEMVHGIGGGEGSAGTAALPNNVRKAANNVAESVRRAIRFLAAMLPADELPEAPLWPEPVRSPKYDRGVRLYRDVRRAHLREGIMDPTNHLPAITERVAAEHAERGRIAGSYGSYNRMVRDLREMLGDGSLPGVPGSLADCLQELRLDPSVGPAKTIPIKELVRRWPDHFRLNASGKIDLEHGLLGYFNRSLGLRRPSGVNGSSCPPENLLGDRSLPGRLDNLRRFLARVATPADTELAECFSADRIWCWLKGYIEERNAVSCMHLQAWWAVMYTAKLYLGIDLTATERLVAEGIQFPAMDASTKGTVTLERAGTNPVATLLSIAAALKAAAEGERELSPKRRVGCFLPRKSAEVEFWIRLLTGLRPENVAVLVFLDAPSPDTLVPAIWREGNGYVVCIPFRCMKQNKRRLRGKPLVSRQPRPERPFIFRIEFPAAVTALDEHLSDGWIHAAAVVEGRTRRLLLNENGEPFKSFEGSQRKTRKRAVRLNNPTEALLPDLDRYATRHIMSELLNRYQPGGNLKTMYLTHKSATNSDKYYGNDDMSYLRRCIHEILEGLPPLPEQERLRAARLEEMERERDKAIADMARRMEATGSDIAKLAAALAAKDEELLRLRGKLAEERVSKVPRQPRAEP